MRLLLIAISILLCASNAKAQCKSGSCSSMSYQASYGNATAKPAEWQKDGSVSWLGNDGYKYSYDADTVKKYGVAAISLVIQYGYGTQSAMTSTSTGCNSGNCSSSASSRRGIFRKR